MEEQQDCLFIDLLQFGLKKASTVVCSSLLKETIEYYNENNTYCSLLLLDASKAFDRVQFTYNTIFAQRGYSHHARSYIFLYLHVECNPTYF